MAIVLHSLVRVMADKKRSAEEAEIVVPVPLFKARALPLHVNVTHTPTTGEDGPPTSPADPGFLGALSLQPSTFSTGSYGWKGSKRLTIELVDPDGGEKEKVQVMLTINATVIGSKRAVKEAEVGAEDDTATSDTSSAEEENVPKPQNTE
ncbi:hypothetical protein EDB92DRAFT_1939394 [Lactarius akahatsu]|uniref:Uncharacterized protein n=1 Tax=Lactarius akahatsu TaxID=416441 RepID=A0AAD4QFX4_9AGAM|nr:hypothetical protein EDB92DRAFT_1939394 [Lactarius akahatsu]